MVIRIIDVRQASEFASGHIAGSELIPLNVLNKASHDWDRSESLELVCKSGMRARIARNQLLRQGFKQVSVLQGGIDAWRAAGRPLVEEAGARTSGQEVLLAAAVAVLMCAVLGRYVSPVFDGVAITIVIMAALHAFGFRARVISALGRVISKQKAAAKEPRR